jgi:transcriptional regulator GlxA family with amidase domain
LKERDVAKITFWTGGGDFFSGIASLRDAFSIANLIHQQLAGKEEHPIFKTEIITTDGRPVVSYGGFLVQPDGSIADVKKTDCVVVSPSAVNVSPMPNDLHIVADWIKSLKKRGAIIATMSLGTFTLAEMGLLDGKTATTNWQYARNFKKRYPNITLKPECMLTEDDGIICTGASTAVFNLAFYLIEKFGSPKLVHLVSKALCIETNRNSQAPFWVSFPLKSHGDDQVMRAQQIIERQYPEIDNIDSIAGEVGISTRHFKRRFQKATGELPSRYLQRVRIEAAKEKLETTNDSIEEITWAIGYQDTSSFSRLFKQYTSLTPKTYRDKFFINFIALR